MRGFHDRLRGRPSSLFLLFGCSSISMASLIIRSMYLDLVENGGVLELNTVAQVNAMFGHG
jgi:hypothetical protein